MRKRGLLLSVLTVLVCSLALHAQVTSDRLVRAADEPQNWLTYSGGYASQRYSLLKQIDPGNAKNLELKWILPDQVFGAWQSTPLVVNGIMYVTQRPNDVLALDAKTGRVFWQYRYTVSPEARVCCGSNNRGVAILGDTLYMGTLDAHLVALDATAGRPLWNVEVGESAARLLDHDGAAHRQGQGPRRRRRRRVRHSRLHRGVRRADRQGNLALLHHPGTRRARQRDVERRRVEDGRRLAVGHALLRSGDQPDVLGRRQPRPRLEFRSAARRQPLHGQRRRARRGHRAAQVALPVFAERHLRLRLRPGRGARGSQLARHADQGDALGEPERLLLRARSHQRPLPLRHAVREGQLGERARRKRTAHRDAAAAGSADLAGQPGRHELVLAVVQPVDRAVLRLRMGKLRVDLPERAGRLRRRPQFRRRRR